MPVYNAESTLERSIESILKQTNSNWELVCVDDGSKDNSLAILHEYAIKDSRIKVFFKENSGPGLTRNFAIDRCIGEYIGFLDSDDYWSEKCVDEIIKTINANDSDIIFLRTKMCYKNVCKDAYNINKFKNASKDDLIGCLMSGVLPWGQEKVIRSSIIKNNKLEFSSDKVGEEAVFSFDAMRFSNIISFISEPMYFYCFYEDGQHKLGDLDPWFNIVKKMKAHLEDNNILNLYESSLNSFALRSLIISSYRICINLSYEDAKKSIKSKFRQYSELFDLNNYSSISLDKKTRFIHWLLKRNLCLLVYFLSQLRNRRR